MFDGTPAGFVFRQLTSVRKVAYELMVDLHPDSFFQMSPFQHESDKDLGKYRVEGIESVIERESLQKQWECYGFT